MPTKLCTPNKIAWVCQSSTQGINPSKRADGDAEFNRCFLTFRALLADLPQLITYGTSPNIYLQTCQ